MTNALGVLAMVHAAGADVAQAADSLATVAPAAGRGERRRIQLTHGTI